uniref:Chitin-binding type-2 domain-containing protein n=1 Tax=Anopheles coluzzii TaxID=1518534 RepID=A0A8W7P614_ANOCL
MAKLAIFALCTLILLLLAFTGCVGQEETTTFKPGDLPFVEVLYRRILRLRCPEGQRWYNRLKQCIFVPTAPTAAPTVFVTCAHVTDYRARASATKACHRQQGATSTGQRIEPEPISFTMVCPRWVVRVTTCLVVVAACLLPAPSAALSDPCSQSTTLAHPTDCRKYLECVDDKLVLLTCGVQYYNASIGGCTNDLPANSCRQRKEDSIVSFDETYLGRAIVDPCASSKPGLKLPHPENCGLFYQCTQSGAALFACPANLLFHVKMRVCVWPQQVECAPGADLPTGTTAGPNTTPGLDNDGNIVLPDEICEPGCFLDLRCPVDCDPILPPKAFPHPSRCDAYFTCNTFGYSCITECPVGMWFSNVFQRCVTPNLSDCTPVVPPICKVPDCRPNPDCPVPDTVPPTKLPHPERDDWYYICRDGTSCQMACPPGLCEKCDPTFFPHDDCDKFYKCNFGLICEMRCPPGLHFNARENVCDWPSQAGCEYPPIIEDPPENAACHPNPLCPPGNGVETFLPHPDNCTLFYKCSWGNACLKECPDGLHWSKAKQRCEWPNLAGCDPNILPDDPNCPTCPCIPCRSKRNACQPSERCPPAGKRSFSLSFSHELHCNQFYECLSGQACILECPKGLEYSGGEARCDANTYSVQPATDAKSHQLFFAFQCCPAGHTFSIATRPTHTRYFLQSESCGS